MAKFDVVIEKKFTYLVKGVEASNEGYLFHPEHLTKDERFKIEQPEKYGQLTEEYQEIIDIEDSEDE